MIRTATILGLLAAATTTGEASMNGRTISAEILDSRVSECGLVIEGDRFATLRPFMKASSDVSGKFRIEIVKKSKSGTNVTSQSNAFRAGRLGGNVIGVDSPSTVNIDMVVSGANGATLCRLRKEVELGDGVIEL